MPEIGDVNRNGQKLLAKTTFGGTDYNEKIWAVQCTRDGCWHVYRMNGSDFHERKCPKCGGEPARVDAQGLQGDAVLDVSKPIRH